MSDFIDLPTHTADGVLQIQSLADINMLLDPQLGEVFFVIDEDAIYVYASGGWELLGGGGDVATDTIWDVKGDIAIATAADTAAVLAVGSNGQVLTADSAEATGVKWTTVAGTGDVVGPGAATDNAIARWNGAGGASIQNSVVTIADTSGNMAGVGTLNTHTIPGGTGTLALTSDITGTNSGTNTGDQTITLTGGVTGSGTGSFAATVVTNANLTGHITSTGNAAVLGSFTSAQLATALTDETGSGSAVFATSPTLVTPLLGTPTSGVLTNCTGTASGLTAGNVTTNANLTGAVTSTGNATTLVGALPLSIPGTGAANQTIYADAKAAFGYTINSLRGAATSSGSITVAAQINGTPVTGLSAVSITSTPADSTATAANVVVAGDIVTWVFTSNSSAADLRFTMQITRS